jgi:hypothetical protein
MTEQEIKNMLDTLADWQARRDLLDADKRALLEDVKVPEEVEQIVSAGMKRIAALEYREDAEYEAQIKAELDAVVIPDEIKAQLAEIDQKRAAIMEKKRRYELAEASRIEAQKRAIQEEIKAQTQAVYDGVAQRKREIEAEFSGKAEAIDENIKRLTDEIKAEVRNLGATVKSTHFQAVYVKGRVTWDTSKMDGYAVGHPEVLFMRKEGEPSITLRRI